MKSKIDYYELKLNFFLSEQIDPKSFIEETLGERNGNYQRKTRWRSEEKRLFKRNLLEKALKDNTEEMEKRLEIRLQFIDELSIKFIKKLEEKLDEDLKIKEMFDIWKIIRTEKGLQTNITKNNALKKIPWEPIDESLLIND